MNKKSECNKKCIELIRSDDKNKQHRGLKKFSLCFKNRANHYLIKKGVHNQIDRDGIFSVLLEKTVKYPPPGDCSYGMFYKTLHDSHATFYGKGKRQDEKVIYKSDAIESETNNHTEEVDVKNCVSSVFRYMEKNYPKDLKFLIAYMNRENNLKNLAKVLLMTHGAVRERKSKVFKLFYQIKNELCEK